MELFFQGILWGLALAILAGPILVALLQAGVEQGLRAGLVVAAGVWLSDFLYIVSVYFGISYVMAATSWSGFELTLGIAGGIILMIFGLGTVLSSPPDLSIASSEIRSNPKLFLKGFLINTANPFTVFFWISVMSVVIVKEGLNHQQALLFFIGLLGTIMLTDSLKILLAEVIRHKLTYGHLLWLRRIAGVILFGFGVALIFRVLF